MHGHVFWCLVLQNNETNCFLLIDMDGLVAFIVYIFKSGKITVELKGER